MISSLFTSNRVATYASLRFKGASENSAIDKNALAKLILKTAYSLSPTQALTGYAVLKDIYTIMLERKEAYLINRAHQKIPAHWWKNRNSMTRKEIIEHFPVDTNILLEQLLNEMLRAGLLKLVHESTTYQHSPRSMPGETAKPPTFEEAIEGKGKMLVSGCHEQIVQAPKPSFLEINYPMLKQLLAEK